ncbi:MAG TPA: threonine synthase, partial [Gemmatimonadaceae bacterium]|nr:threonine synthase [Gemmatimonadaceae bacterium]
KLGAKSLAAPTAGNAGAALSAYGARAGLPVFVAMPTDTPQSIVDECRSYGAEVDLVTGVITHAAKRVQQYIAANGGFDLSTLKEPYRVEGKKIMGYELLEDLGRLPDAILYPTGGGTGLIGMWKVFGEMRDGGWLARDAQLPRMIVAQPDGCAPIVRAWRAGAEFATPWEDPETHASGLRVPGPLGDRLILRALRESKGDAASVSEEAIRRDTLRLSRRTGVDAAPEGGCALAVLDLLVRDRRIASDAEVLLFNTGSGASYRF